MIKRCSEGHVYDPEKYSSCPHCGIPDLDMGKTTPRQSPPPARDDRTRPARRPEGDKGAGPVAQDRGRVVPDDEGRTKAFVREKLGFDPVVGWLVCVDGPDRGRDYRLRSERNSIGRSERMDVCIRGDETISRDNHAGIVFNPRDKSFVLLPGEGRGLVYLGGEAVYVPTPLSPYDAVELGKTRLVFVPFCGERFQWD